MCNLSVGVFERGWNQAWDRALDQGVSHGKEEGRVENTKKIIINLLKMKMGIAFIVTATNSTEEQVRQIAKEENLPLKE